MKWYNYLASFFFGVFLVNSIPHFLHGISGDYFPTPFADPPGKGLSPPVLNLVWAYINLIISFLLYKGSKITFKNKWATLLFITGFFLMSIELCFALTGKDTSNEYRTPRIEYKSNQPLLPKSSNIHSQGNSVMD